MKYLNKRFSVPVQNERYDEIDWCPEGWVERVCPRHGVVTVRTTCNVCPFCRCALLADRRGQEE